MTTFHTHLFSSDDGGFYYDSLHTTVTPFRFMAGDIVYVGDYIFGEVGYKIEILVFIGSDHEIYHFHAYCNKIRPNKPNKMNFGVRGDDGSLLTHIENQIDVFPHLYKKKDVFDDD